MSSILMDYLVDKLFPFSSKMNIESSKFSGSSYLTIANSNSLSHQLCPVDLFGGLIGDAILNSETPNQVMSPKQSFDFLSGNYSFSFLNAEKPFYPMSNFAMSTYRHSHGSSDSRFLSNKLLIGNLANSLQINQPSEMDWSHKYNCDVTKSPVPLAFERKMSENATHSLDKKKCDISNKYTIANTSTLNKELANRKTKEMHKRSKKRRRRQRKNQQFDCSSSASVSDDDVDSSVTSSLTSVCVVSGSAEYGCTLAVSHSVQMTPNIMSSFVVTVDSATDDDSEWESYEAEQCNMGSQVNQKADTNTVSPNLAKSKNTNSNYLRPADCDYQKAASFISSFIVSVENSSDDESDWDTCDTEILNDTHDFEFTGLLVTSLCTPPTLSPDTNYSSNLGEDDETIKLQVHLREVNKTWNESTQGIEAEPKFPSKVSFAPDEALVEVFPVDLHDRKGEWEIYATERLRFKRKIDELEKILSPCFNPDHRSKVFKKINEFTL